MTSLAATQSAPHVPVLIDPLIAAVSPVSGTWVDGTFGAGGYTRRLLQAGADQVIAIDRDPSAFDVAADLIAASDGKIVPVETTFSKLDEHCDQVDGVVLDLGVSSMQLDQAARGFSFAKEGPLDMRMGNSGPTAADIVNTTDEAGLADILYLFGEERASRRIARAIVRRRDTELFTRTLDLAQVVEGCLPRPKPNQSHPATRSFQAIRIAVNAEYDQLVQGLAAAERALKPEGLLAVVTFHSVEDRIVKRFFQSRTGGKQGSRYGPAVEETPGPFALINRKAIGADDVELAANPRSRSAKLRVARRTEADSLPIDLKRLAVPTLPQASNKRRS